MQRPANHNLAPSIPGVYSVSAAGGPADSPFQPAPPPGPAFTDELRSQIVAESLWVARLIISEATKVKLSGKHGLDWRDINQAVVGVRGLDF